MLLFRWLLTCLLVLGLALPTTGSLANVGENSQQQPAQSTAQSTTLNSANTISELSDADTAYFLLPSSAPVEQSVGNNEGEGHDEPALATPALKLSNRAHSVFFSAIIAEAVTRFYAPYTARAPPYYC